MAILPQHFFLRQLGRLVGHLLPPGNCLLCSTESGAAPLCPACAEDLPRLPAKLCPQCGEPTTYGERCGACLRKAPHFTSSSALFRYEFPTDRLIQSLKYAHQLAIANWLGELLARRLEHHPCDLIIPMPLHPGRLRERGFNQSVEIARPLARARKMPLSLDLLERVRPTAPQAELTLDKRAGNVRGAFECRRDLAGCSVLLIDDVMTSGATLNECARVLKLHGASRVDVAVAARALKQ